MRDQENHPLTRGIYAAGSSASDGAKLSRGFDRGDAALIACEAGHASAAYATAEATGQSAADLIRLNSRKTVAANGAQGWIGWLGWHQNKHEKATHVKRRSKGSILQQQVNIGPVKISKIRLNIRTAL